MILILISLHVQWSFARVLVKDKNKPSNQNTSQGNEGKKVSLKGKGTKAGKNGRNNNNVK